MHIISILFSSGMGWEMMVRIQKTRYAVEGMEKGMRRRIVGRCAAGGAGSGAIADEVESKTPSCMEVQSRVGDQEKPVYDVLYLRCLSSKSIWILSVVALILC